MKINVARSFLIIAASAFMSSCSTLDRQGSTASPTVKRLTLDRGPCFGFCPVYTLEITSDAVSFEGVRHTDHLGRIARDSSPDLLLKTEEALAKFRPLGGEEETLYCAAQPTDTSNITITWSDATESSSLNYKLGSHSDVGRELEAQIDAVLMITGAKKWAEQKTRTGVSRG